MKGIDTLELLELSLTVILIAVMLMRFKKT